jgi:hypothetical protein
MLDLTRAQIGRVCDALDTAGVILAG